MAGFSRVYVIGGGGGFMGADGVNPIHLQILQGEGDRQWLEPHYFDRSLGPLGALKTMVPEGPDHPDALLDACIAFFPAAFRACPSLQAVAQELADTERLDFQLASADVPKLWSRLREEARPIFRQLGIWHAELMALQPEVRGIHADAV